MDIEWESGRGVISHGLVEWQIRFEKPFPTTGTSDFLAFTSHYSVGRCTSQRVTSFTDFLPDLSFHADRTVHSFNQLINCWKNLNGPFEVNACKLHAKEAEVMISKIVFLISSL